MIKVSNQGCIRRLSNRSLSAAKYRNIIAVTAIALTAMLFTSLFTIAADLNNAVQMSNFRQAGGMAHASFKSVSEEQAAALSRHPSIEKYGMRLFLGMPAAEPPFLKAHVEVSYMDSKEAELYFCVPEHGTLPQEGTNQIATDTRVLKLLGIEPEIGAKVPLTYELGTGTHSRQKVTGEFVLSGWWEHDPACIASHIVTSRSYADEVLKDYISMDITTDMTGKWNLDVMFSSSLHIQDDVDKVLAANGWQDESPNRDNYISTGINWGYSGAQLSNALDPTTVLGVSGILLLIIFTGYLIIYNVFQISVTNDIRFYGLLKTIGTTGKQIKSMIRRQAYTLSLFGIPIGLLLGWILGGRLAPIIIRNISDSAMNIVSAQFNPIIFIGAALFALITIHLSCSRPGRLAARVSPVEALRYSEGSSSSSKSKKGLDGGKVQKMAFSNLGRSKGKTFVTILSLSLSVILLNTVVTFINGFDMDKYLKRWVSADFIFAGARYFQFTGIEPVPEDVLEPIKQQGIGKSGHVYTNGSCYEHMPIDHFEELYRYLSESYKENVRAHAIYPNNEFMLDNKVRLLGMDDFPLSLLDILDGDIEKLKDPSGNYIVAVPDTDDFTKPDESSYWAKVGDQVTIRYVDDFNFIDQITGKVIEREDTAAWEKAMEEVWPINPTKYRDVTYTVAAVATVPYALSHRFGGGDSYVLPAETLKRDDSNTYLMSFVFDAAPEKLEDMDRFLKDYTESVEVTFDYESKAQYVSEFAGMQRTFLIVGGVLSGIIGIVGVLNFLNAVLTSILARKREFAVLQSIGMTGKQLKAMLVWEGTAYAGISILLSLALSLGMSGLLKGVAEGMFWFFTYRFTVTPVLCVAPVFLIMGVCIPLVVYRFAAKQSIVERLRQTE